MSSRLHEAPSGILCARTSKLIVDSDSLGPVSEVAHVLMMSQYFLSLYFGGTAAG